jgi:hypothetical protein
MAGRSVRSTSPMIALTRASPSRWARRSPANCRAGLGLLTVCRPLGVFIKAHGDERERAADPRFAGHAPTIPAALQPWHKDDSVTAKMDERRRDDGRSLIEQRPYITSPIVRFSTAHGRAVFKCPLRGRRRMARGWSITAPAWYSPRYTEARHLRSSSRVPCAHYTIGPSKVRQTPRLGWRERVAFSDPPDFTDIWDDRNWRPG